MEVDGAHLRGYCDPLMSGVVHSVNAVHGMLDHMGVAAGDVVGGHIFAGGEGAAGTVSLLDGARALALRPGAGAGRRVVPRALRAALRADRVIELQFPSPYLNNQQTDLWVRRSQGLRLDTAHVQAGYGRRSCASWRGSHERRHRGRAGAKHGRGRRCATRGLLTAGRPPRDRRRTA